MSKISVPEVSLILMMGPSGAGKSSFCSRHFLSTEVISSDQCRAMVCDDELSQEWSAQAFDVLHRIVEARLKIGRFTVVDATNVEPEARKPLITLAKKYHVMVAAIVLEMPAELCLARNNERQEERPDSRSYVERQAATMAKSVAKLEREGIRYVYRLKTLDEVQAAVIERQRLWTNRRDESGPFDIIGDIHGCYDELCSLLERLGYHRREVSDGSPVLYRHPEGRRVIFLGDFVDRGPKIRESAALVMNMCAEESAICVPGNHEIKLAKHLEGRKVKVSHGLEESIAQLKDAPQEFRDQLRDFIHSLVSHYVLDGGKLVVAHAGLKEELQGRASGAVRSFALFGETTGECDAYGLPVRLDWAREYRGKATVVYGHIAVTSAEWVNNTICVDTGCVFGGSLTALRWPEREICSVPAQREYYARLRPYGAAGEIKQGVEQAPSEQQVADTVLDWSDLAGKRTIDTTLLGKIAVREDQAAAAMESLSRFAVDPRWLIYLPPTMAPCDTPADSTVLEHTDQALEYYAKRDINDIILEEKYMGSRAIIVVCRDQKAARLRFHSGTDATGSVYTRNGRSYFDSRQVEAEFLGSLAAAAEAAGLWQDLGSDWMVLDAEMLPWAYKAEGLIDRQFLGVANSGEAMLSEALRLLAQGEARVPDLEPLRQKISERLHHVRSYREALAPFIGQSHEGATIHCRPFHLLASEGAMHLDKDHTWHLQMLARLSDINPATFGRVSHQVVDLRDPKARDKANAFWQSITDKGGEGIVVKPLSFTSRHKGRMVQPALKVRGPEYLRLVYGPEYLRPDIFERVKQRSVGRKMSLAVRQFALGAQALQSFLARDPLRLTHQCVMAILALGAEDLDARL